ncbi:hypothetical protein [Legionella bozemanae]|uniref:Outer membrane protein beta-barrel domain-containing protein n=1 Tax=Legionella bozemanae TaxID=447 RepID=A0A0W0RYB8_LEGBO|nr:hypothetical protein [Legionella bozemanae]KTC75921.1 hypothetical protein Lboz_0749 [Legionella bozemanae]STO35453.1 Uncharacterised protein [Legionella bozemanae]
MNKANIFKMTSLIIPGFLAANICHSGTTGTPVLPIPMWSIGIEGGVAPTNYSTRSPTYLFNQSAGFGLSSVSSTNFSDQFHTPYTIGAEIARLIAPSTSVFVEGNYFRGDSKTYYFTLRGINISHTFDYYESYGIYLGGRYISNYFSNKFLPYIGAKVGFMNYRAVNASEHFLSVPIPSEIDPYYSSDTTVSGGVHIGLDYSMSETFSLGVKFEVLASGSRLSQVVQNKIPAPNVAIGNTGTLVSYPIEAILKYKF